MVASGIVRSGEDRVQVLVFVNRPTTNKPTTEPVVYKDQVTVTMERSATTGWSTTWSPHRAQRLSRDGRVRRWPVPGAASA